MRLHTYLTEVQMHMSVPRDVMLRMTRHGSRTHPHAFEVQLRGFGTRHTRCPNTGRYGADGLDGMAATWSDWGRWLAGVFERDPNARVAGSYASAADFHAKTHGLFIPDAHRSGIGPAELAADVSAVQEVCGLKRGEAITHVAERYGLTEYIVTSAIFGE